MRFFDTKVELNIVLAGYVADFMGKLMEVYYYELCRYVFENPQRLALIAQHAYDTSICKNVLYPIIFQAGKDLDLETSILEKKLEREHIEKLLRPQRAKLLKDIWDRCFNSQNVELIVNVFGMFKDAVMKSPKEESYKAFLYDTLYSKPVVHSLFQFMLNTDVC